MAFSETELQLKDLRGKDFSAISVDDARILAGRAGNAENGAIADAFVQAAMRSGRLELMELCWENRDVSRLFWDEYRKMPEGHLKNQLFSSRLRNPRIPWPDDKPGEVSNGNGTQRMSLERYYIPIFRKFLPDLPMDYSEIGSREKRLKLADAFDKAVGIPIVVEPEARRVGPSPRGDKQAANVIVLAASPAASAPTRATVPVGDAVSFRAKNLVWFSILAAALAGSAAWVFLRSRRKG